MKKNIYFFDKNEVLLDRYPASIAQEMMKKNRSESFNFIFIQSEYFKKGQHPTKIPKNSKVFYNPFLTPKKLDPIVKKHPPHAFICIGLRIPDILLICYFNKLNVNTYMVQHGLFIKHLTRIPFVYHIASKFSQFRNYFIYSYHISNIIQKPFYNTVKDLFSFFIGGKGRFADLPIAKSTNLISTTVFAFDKLWNEYYFKYGYKPSQFVYFGNPDYSLVHEVLKNDLEDAICYICQTLVEDGRYLRKDYIEFIGQLKTNLKGRKVYLKLHPRSDLDLYKKFEDDDFVLTREFKNCYTFLGHYSSLLEVSHQLGRNVILWDLENHPIPKNYYKYSDFVTKDFEELRNYLSQDLKGDFEIKEEMNDFLQLGKEPFKTISEKIEGDIFNTIN